MSGVPDRKHTVETQLLVDGGRVDREARCFERKALLLFVQTKFGSNQIHQVGRIFAIGICRSC